jgi:myosin heavy subunit
MDSMQKDKDMKLQVTAARCKKLEAEVESLRTVLELRHEELQELRKQNALLTREAEELPVALHRVAALEAKVEDLKVQLQMKTNLERQLSEMESVHQESKQSKRLLLRSEELQWKLKQTVESVTALAALSGASMTDFLQASSAKGTSPHSSAQSLADSDTATAGNKLFSTRPSKRPLSTSRSHNSDCSDLSVGSATAAGRSGLGEDVETSPPASPKVKGVVEKSDSISWVVDIDELPEANASVRVSSSSRQFSGHCVTSVFIAIVFSCQNFATTKMSASQGFTSLSFVVSHSCCETQY